MTHKKQQYMPHDQLKAIITQLQTTIRHFVSYSAKKTIEGCILIQVEYVLQTDHHHVHSSDGVCNHRSDALIWYRKFKNELGNLLLLSKVTLTERKTNTNFYLEIGSY